MSHGRKSRSVLSGGYKRHVLRDLDTGLVPVVGITPANAPEASVTSDITAGLDAAGRTLAELHIDRAYLASDLVRDRGPDLAIYCKAWKVRNTGGRYPKTDFALDFPAGQLTCPAGITMPFTPGTTVHFPKATCAACPLHHQQPRPLRVHPPRRGPAGRTARAPGHPRRAPSSASASRSGTPWPTSAAGKAAAPATPAPARTYSTCAAPPSCTTSTSPHAIPPAGATRWQPDDYLTGALADHLLALLHAAMRF